MGGKLLNGWKVTVTVILFTLELAFCFEECIRLDSCSCRLKNSGKVISLQDLERESSSTPVFNNIQASDYQFLYYYNPCTAFAQSGSVSKALAFQSDVSGGSVKDIADPGLTVSYDTMLNNYIFSYEGSNPDGMRSFKVSLVCDSTATKPTLEPVSEGTKLTYVWLRSFRPLFIKYLMSHCLIASTLCSMTTLLRTRCACSGACRYEPNYVPKPGSSKSGLSIGSILCIVLLVIVIVYVSAGLLVNTFLMKKEVSDRIPNKSFWMELPSYVKDGCFFTYSKIRRRDNSYEAIR